MALATILEKVGTMTVNHVPVNEELLPYYLRALEDKRGSIAVEKLTELPSKELKAAIKALIQDDQRTLNALLGASGEDVMDHIERSDKDIESLGRRNK